MDFQDQRLINLISIAKEQYTRLVWTHKVHEKEREILASKEHRIKLLNVWLVGLTAAVAAYNAYSSSEEGMLIAALLGTFSTAFLVYQQFFDKENKVVEHRVAAKHLLSLRERTLFLVESIMSENDDYNSLRTQLEKLRMEEIKVMELIPDTSPDALEMAKKALNEKKDTSNLDCNAEQFLPKSLWGR